jgi:sugar lactone lactonase YvrE
MSRACRLWVVVCAASLSLASTPAAWAEEEGLQQTPASDATAATYVEPSDGQPAVDVPSAEAPADASGQAVEAKPTHKQSALIDVNAEGLAQASVQCFCLTSDDALLAGCSGPANEIRKFDAEGKYVESFELPVAPEALNVAPDGTILVAGEGKLLRLSPEGEKLAEVESPHAEAMRDSATELRQEVIDQHKLQAEMLPQMLETYDQAMAGIEEQIKQLEEQGDAEEQIAESKQMLERYEDAKEQVKKQYGDAEAAELTEEQIDEMVDASMKGKLAVASISGTDDTVFIACRMTVGYGYEVWRLNAEFADGKKVIEGLSGCCGQMDVQANGEGVFVAENSRKRVRRFDADGQSVCDWGKASESVHGFGSCCNPMNLAFGADGVVYTAEDTTGRIKRYKPDGTLLSLVGAADVVPGCKKVSIGVDRTGDRVYMLDITRNHIAVLSRVEPDPTGPLADTDASSGGVGSAILRALGLGG